MDVDPKYSSSVHTHGEPKASLVSNTLAILGFIIVIVIVLWGLFHIATLAAPWFSSLFGNSADSISVEAPESATSGTPFAIEWRYSTSEQGTYAFLYQCKDTLRFQIAGEGGTVSTVPCGAAFTISPTNNTLTVTPELSGTASTTVPLSIIFIPSATTSPHVQGSATIAIAPRAIAPIPQPSTSTPPTAGPFIPVTPTPVVTGHADLSVQIISLAADGSGGAVATFDIGNVGTGASGTYYFTAQLPTSDGYLYNSPAQSSLAPGDHIVNTLRFSQATSGLFSVVVDPANTKNESNTNNNYAAQNLSMPYIPQIYPQPYQYPYVY